jgi:hypothetical protein
LDAGPGWNAFLEFLAFAMEPDSIKTDGKKGEMMQGQQMTADEMVKKGDEMIAQGKEMKKQGMMMKKKEMKAGSMKQDKMMNENGMAGDKMNGKGTE